MPVGTGLTIFLLSVDSESWDAEDAAASVETAFLAVNGSSSLTASLTAKHSGQ